MESPEITAISSMSKITESVITALLQKMDRIVNLQETMYREQDAMNQNVHAMRRELKEVVAELERIAGLLPSDTTMALTGPLLDLQNDSKRRRENSALRRRQTNETGY